MRLLLLRTIDFFLYATPKRKTLICSSKATTWRFWFFGYFCEDCTNIKLYHSSLLFFLRTTTVVSNHFKILLKTERFFPLFSCWISSFIPPPAIARIATWLPLLLLYRNSWKATWPPSVGESIIGVRGGLSVASSLQDFSAASAEQLSRQMYAERKPQNADSNICQFHHTYLWRISMKFQSRDRRHSGCIVLKSTSFVFCGRKIGQAESQEGRGGGGGEVAGAGTSSRVAWQNIIESFFVKKVGSLRKYQIEKYVLILIEKENDTLFQQQLFWKPCCTGYLPSPRHTSRHFIFPSIPLQVPKERLTLQPSTSEFWSLVKR